MSGMCNGCNPMCGALGCNGMSNGPMCNGIPNGTQNGMLNGFMEDVKGPFFQGQELRHDSKISPQESLHPATVARAQQVTS